MEMNGGVELWNAITVISTPAIITPTRKYVPLAERF
jgi:hypothetical protein